MSSSGSPAAAAGSPDDDTLVQYVCVLRTKALKGSWPAGAFVAQGCHACVAAVWLSRDEPETRAYLSTGEGGGDEGTAGAGGGMDRMHKIVLESDSTEALVAAHEGLRAAGITAKLWVEQPEGLVAALASRPGRRVELRPHFAGFKLMR